MVNISGPLKSSGNHFNLSLRHWLKQTLLFMNAFKHWMSLCWFRLSILSCLKKKNTLKRLYEQRKCKNGIRITEIWWDVMRDHSLFLVKQLLQSIQKETETLMTEVINPTRKKARTNKEKSVIQYSFQIVIALLVYCKPCWFTEGSKHKQYCINLRGNQSFRLISKVLHSLG